MSAVFIYSCEYILKVQKMATKTTKDKPKRTNWKQRYYNYKKNNAEPVNKPWVSVPVVQTVVTANAVDKAMRGADGNAYNNIPEKIIPRTKEELELLGNGAREVFGNIMKNKTETLLYPVGSFIAGRIINKKCRAPGVTIPVVNARLRGW